MEKSSATKIDDCEKQQQEVVQIGSVVAVEFGDGHQRVFLVTNADKELPEDAIDDELPEEIVLAPNTMPLVRDIIGQPAGYHIKPVQHNKSQDFPAYRREGVTILDVVSIEDFLTRSNGDNQRNADDKTDK